MRDAGVDPELGHRPRRYGGSRWRRRWDDFITSGGRVSEDDTDYLRATLMNLLGAASLVFCVVLLALGLLGILYLTPARLIIDALGAGAALALIVSLRRGVPAGLCAHAANGVLLLGLLGLTVTRGDQPLTVTLTLIYPALTFLLLDSVRGGAISTGLMIVGANVAIVTGPAMAPLPWRTVLDVAVTMTAGLCVLGAVMALYVHHRQRVIARLISMGEQLAELASRDSLTGLYNRRTFVETIERELGRRDGDSRVLAFLLCDIDHFKAYNDRFGHPEGDELLKRIAAALRGVFSRREDFLFRLGGEEFGALYRAATPERAAGMAERTLAAIEALGAPAPEGPHEAVTAAAGLELVRPDTQSADEVYRRADAALYRAKEAGRARWMYAGNGEQAG